MSVDVGRHESATSRASISPYPSVGVEQLPGERRVCVIVVIRVFQSSGVHFSQPPPINLRHIKQNMSASCTGKQRHDTARRSWIGRTFVNNYGVSFSQRMELK